jgi:hypothetical protein
MSTMTRKNPLSRMGAERFQRMMGGVSARRTDYIHPEDEGSTRQNCLLTRGPKSCMISMTALSSSMTTGLPGEGPDRDGLRETPYIGNAELHA